MPEICIIGITFIRLGVMSHEKLSRNREIHAKRNQGASYVELAKEYGVSITRIREIDAQVRHREIYESPDIPEIVTACKKFRATDWINGRIQNELRKRHLNVKNRWRKITRDEILKMDWLGERAADIIEYAQKL
jgi:hypothetical protein